MTADPSPIGSPDSDRRLVVFVRAQEPDDALSTAGRVTARLAGLDVAVEVTPEPDPDRVRAAARGVWVVPCRTRDMVLAGVERFRGLARLAVVDDEVAPGERARWVASGVEWLLLHSHAAEDTAFILQSLRSDESAPTEGIEAEPRLADFLSRSASMRRFIRQAKRVAAADATLLITGETGVGKERLARAVHAESDRAAEAFVSVNCGAFPEALLESQLFGHEKGAFTGAAEAHRGFFEQADGGTLFLDEIGELPLHLQVRFLTVLQRQEIQRLGAEEIRRVDVRIIAATHQDLPARVAEGAFREDLYHRLNVVTLRIPPLRERRQDIPELVGWLVEHFSESMPDRGFQGVSPAALQLLIDYRWPGNVRELIHTIERAAVLGTHPEIQAEDLPDTIRMPDAGSAATATEPDQVEPPVAAAGGTYRLPSDWAERGLKDVRLQVVDAVERAFVVAALERTGGQMAAAAKLAGIGRRALYDKLKRLGIDKDAFRPG